MSFAFPWILGLLLLLPLWLWYVLHRKEGSTVGFSTSTLLKTYGRRNQDWKHHVFTGLRLITLALLIIGSARPQVGQDKVKRSSEGLDIVLVVDTSGSMKAMDFQIDGEHRNRLYVVKKVLEDFINKRVDDRIGLVVFGTEAFTQAPLTIDHQVLTSFLNTIQIGMAGESTAIGNAIATGVKRLKDIDAKSKVMILLTDGENTAGSVEPLQAAEAAKTLGIKIYTIGVGSDEPVPFPVETWFRTVYEKRQVKLDEKLLREIAELTGGKFFIASDTKQLQEVYDTIDQLETTKIDIPEYLNVNEIGHWFIAAALASLMLEVSLGLSSWRRIP